jgi:hypothetical protein
MLLLAAMLFSAAQVQVGQIRGAMQGIHDLAVVRVTPSKTIVGQGFGLQVDVTVSNIGNYQEKLNVTLYANATAIAASIGEFVPSGTSLTIEFSWNTAIFDKSNYTLSAYSQPVPDEMNTADNYLAGGWVVVAMPGDLNGWTSDLWTFVPDGKVDLKDLVTLAQHFFSKPGDVRWSPECDLDNDGRVNMKDLIICARNFDRSIDQPTEPPPEGMNLIWAETFAGKQIVRLGTYPSVQPFSVPNVLVHTASVGSKAELVADAEHGTVLHCYVPQGLAPEQRCEFDLDIGSPQEYYMTLTLKLPADYAVANPYGLGAGGWHEIFDAVDEWQPDNPNGLKVKLWIREDDRLALRADRGAPSGQVWATPTVKYVLPLGEWFTLSVRLVRHPTDGQVTVWVDDNKVFDVSGVMTAERATYSVLTTKAYGGVITPKEIWCAGLELYSRAR